MAGVKIWQPQRWMREQLTFGGPNQGRPKIVCGSEQGDKYNKEDAQLCNVANPNTHTHHWMSSQSIEASNWNTASNIKPLLCRESMNIRQRVRLAQLIAGAWKKEKQHGVASNIRTATAVPHPPSKSLRKSSLQTSSSHPVASGNCKAAWTNQWHRAGGK